MIRYNLICESAHTFEAWFSDSAGFDQQKAQGFLSCPNCGSANVDKALMAPAIGKRSEESAPSQSPEEVREMIRSLHKHVEDTAEWVGDRFPDEVRKMHYGEEEKRHVYGQATGSDIRELHEEGIPVMPLPRLPEQAN